MSDFNPIYGTGSDATANSDIVDLELPSIPEAPVEEKIEVKDRDPVGFKFGFIGAGQGGGKIAESFHQAGYARVGVINTADQDLASVNVPHKFKFGEQQGAGKDRSVARKAFVNQREDVVDFIKASIGEDVDRIFVTVGAGGTGGAAQTVDDTTGNNGTAGGESLFGSWARARNGLLAFGGSTTSGLAGSGGGSLGEFAAGSTTYSATGGAGSASAGTNSGNRGGYRPGGGGGGSGFPINNTTGFNGQTGGAGGSLFTTSVSGLGGGGSGGSRAGV